MQQDSHTPRRTYNTRGQFNGITGVRYGIFFINRSLLFLTTPVFASTYTCRKSEVVLYGYWMLQAILAFRYLCVFVCVKVFYLFTPLYSFYASFHAQCNRNVSQFLKSIQSSFWQRTTTWAYLALNDKLVISPISWLNASHNIDTFSNHCRFDFHRIHWQHGYIRNSLNWKCIGSNPFGFEMVSRAFARMRDDCVYSCFWLFRSIDLYALFVSVYVWECVCVCVCVIRMKFIFYVTFWQSHKNIHDFSPNIQQVVAGLQQTKKSYFPIFYS